MSHLYFWPCKALNTFAKVMVVRSLEFSKEETVDSNLSGGVTKMFWTILESLVPNQTIELDSQCWEVDQNTRSLFLTPSSSASQTPRLNSAFSSLWSSHRLHIPSWENPISPWWFHHRDSGKNSSWYSFEQTCLCLWLLLLIFLEIFYFSNRWVAW